MTHDTCDFCFREFGRTPGQAAVCPSCGLTNVRPLVVETATPRLAPEQAVRVGRRRRREVA